MRLVQDPQEEVLEVHILLTEEVRQPQQDSPLDQVAMQDNHLTQDLIITMNSLQDSGNRILLTHRDNSNN
jgi:hypothetical protein